MSFLKQWQPLVGLDLGSEMVRMWQPDQDIIAEANLIALDQQGKVVQTGNKAQKLVGQASASLKLVRSFEGGVLSDADSLVVLLNDLFSQLKTKSLLRPVVLVSVSGLATPAVREELVKAVYQTGVKEVILINQLLAAAIGGGVPIADPSGSFIFHLGAGGAEVGVVSLSKTVHKITTHHGSNFVRDKIFWEFKKEHLLEIGDQATMSLLTQELVLGQPVAGKIKVAGKDLRTGRPQEIEVERAWLQTIATAVGQDYLALIHRLLQQVPPDLSSNLVEKGMLLSGGAAAFQGLDKFLTAQLGVPAMALDKPELLVIKGIKTVLENLEQFRKYLAG